MTYRLVLASQSPRRKELLGWMDTPFDICPSDVEERTSETEPIAFAKDLARLKGDDIWKKKGPPHLVVSSDTIVELEGKIYGKPQARGEAKEMLLELANRWHNVVTAVFIKAEVEGKEKEHCFAVKTRVKFGEIGSDIMEHYLDSKESMDKAGAYGIQGKGLLFVEGIEGSYSNVVGFPLVEFIAELKKFLGISKSIPESVCWRELFK